MITIITITETLGRMPTYLADAWRAWLDQHDIRPNEVPLDQDLTIDHDARTVTLQLRTTDTAGHTTTATTTRPLHSPPPGATNHEDTPA